MQNGALGEARTKAFLANRFWVLERSVDVQGADFLIQRNVLNQSVLDQHPPRFGIIQAKFVKSERTELRIPAEYLLRRDSEPVEEFFLIVCTGYGDAERMFLLSAADIAARFKATTREGREVYASPAAALISGSNFEISGARDTALERIDNALLAADYSRNRSYLYGLGFGGPSPAPLEADYLLPIEHYHGSIPEYFDRLKRSATTALYSLEEAAAPLNTIIESSDPFVIAKAVEEVSYLLNAEGRLSLDGGQDIYVEEMMPAVRDHKALLERARAADVLGAFLALLEKARTEFGRFVTANAGKPPAAVHLSTRYDQRTLRLESLTVWGEDRQCSGADDGEYAQCRVISTWPGHQELCLNGRWAFQPDWRTKETSANAWVFRLVLQRLVDEQTFGTGT